MEFKINLEAEASSLPRIEILPGQSVGEECLLACNSLRHIDPKNRQARLDFLTEQANQGAAVYCPKPRPGQHHLICGLPEMTKRQIEPVVRQQLAAQPRFEISG